MRRFILFSLVLFCQGAFLYGQLVFPGAEGFGANNRSAYGGTVEPRILIVNSLLDNNDGDENEGKGTLRWCLSRTYPRIVLFEVGGTIHLNENLEVEHPFVLVAGQTAPSPGILITTSTTVIRTHHVLFQHLSFRAGDDPAGSKPESRDCIAIFTGACHDITIDHCSMLWGLDENLGTWGMGDPISNITISNCIIAQGLNYSISPDGGHSKGLLIGYNTRNISILKNFIAHHDDRNPLLQGGTDSEVINNLMYNGNRAVSFNSYDEMVTEASVINNNVVQGYDFTEDYVARFVYMNTNSSVYLSGNTYTDNDWDYIVGNSLGNQVRVDSPPVSSERVEILAKNQIDSLILTAAGPRPWERSAADQQVLDDYVNGMGRIVDCVDSDDVLYDEGTAISATHNTIRLDETASGEDRAYEFKSIEILSGTGAGQRRDVASYSGSNHVVTVSADWDIIPDGSSTYTMIVNCGNNAGGWRLLESSFGAPDIPDDPHGDSNSNGYTNLEEWIHALSTQVEIPVTEIVVTGTGGATSIDVDQGTLQMLADVLPEEATNKRVTWSVENGSGQATISSQGLLTAVGDGTVTVVATSSNGLVRGELVITISNQDPFVQVTDIVVTGEGGATAIDVDNGTLQMYAEVLPVDATDKSVTWSVTNSTGQATISATGLLTALSDGTVTAVATSWDGQIRRGLIVTISNQDQYIPVSDIVVTGEGGVTSIEVDQGTLQLYAEVLPANATDKSVTWSVYNSTGQATINSSGLLTAVSNGAVTAIATSSDGLIRKGLIVAISNQDSYIPVSDIIVTGEGGTNTIDEDGGTLQMYAEVLPENATVKDVTWSVYNTTGQATINTSGLLAAVSNGAVTAIATSSDGLIRRGQIISISNQSTTGIPDSETGPDILVYRNSIMINTNQNGDSWIGGLLKVYSVNGVEIHTSRLKQGFNQVDIHAGPGIYIIILQSTEEFKYHKVFID